MGHSLIWSPFYFETKKSLFKSNYIIVWFSFCCCCCFCTYHTFDTYCVRTKIPYSWSCQSKPDTSSRFIYFLKEGKILKDLKTTVGLVLIWFETCLFFEPLQLLFELDNITRDGTVNSPACTQLVKAYHSLHRHTTLDAFFKHGWTRVTRTHMSTWLKHHWCALVRANLAFTTQSNSFCYFPFTNETSLATSRASFTADHMVAWFEQSVAVSLWAYQTFDSCIIRSANTRGCGISFNSCAIFGTCWWRISWIIRVRTSFIRSWWCWWCKLFTLKATS